ncbi:MAG: hypothetical protein M3R27_10550 [Bacteroidota bacterium]|nr:hypothetical protein [Bacteroidota bacterium]
MANKLEQQLLELEAKIEQTEILSPAISSSSVGWHVEHTLLTINAIIEALKRSDPSQYKWEFSLPKILVFMLNKIPRGRAKAPGQVQPQPNFNKITLAEHIKKTRAHLKDIQPLSANHYFEHPYFGKLNIQPTVKFLGIHTQHHLDIINDIIKQKN